MYLVHADDTRDLKSEYAALSDAAGYAIRLADELDAQRVGGEGASAKQVDVYLGDRLQISIRIMRGGLLGNKAVPILRSM